MASSESIYGGQNYGLDPMYGKPIENYPVNFSQMSTSLDARTANQLKQVSEHLNTGIRNVEVAGHSPEVFDAIPKEQLREIHRLSKLTGTETSMHAPMIDPTGIGEKGFDEMQRKNAEEQLWNAVKRSHDLNPEGNMIVNFHASTVGIPTEIKMKDGKEEKTKMKVLVTPDGRLAPIKEEDKYFAEEGKFTGEKLKFDPEKATKEMNDNFWNSQLNNLHNSAFWAKRSLSEIEKPGELLNESKKELEDVEKNIQELQKNLQNQDLEESQQAQNIMRLQNQIAEEEKLKRQVEQLNRLKESGKFEESQDPHAKLYARSAYDGLKQNFDLIYPAAKGRDKEKLDEFANEIIKKDITKLSASDNPEDVKNFIKIIEKGINTLTDLKDTQILKPLREFAIDKSSETASNIALKSYKEFKETAPIVAIENHPAFQSMLTTGEDIKDVVIATREKFIEKAIKPKDQGGEGLSKDEAKKQAEKLIGATWDVGHINMLRKYGYDSNDIVKESKKVAPFVKHVHLSDNFGFEHTELPMGMGNVPMKEIMDNLNNEGFQGKKVIEALSWWQHFSEQGKIHALAPTMGAMGSGVYGSGAMGSYFGGQGAINPEVHHSLYGSGFSSLPAEFGGQMAGRENQRFSGTPMS